jgi:hypothetical protein
MASERFWQARPDPAAASGPPVARAGHALARIPPPARLFLVMLGLLFLWYGVIGSMRAGIETNVALRPGPELLPPGGSVTAAMAARLLQDQVAERAFTPNDPLFYPTGLAQRTPAFQTSLIETISGAVIALAGPSEGTPLADAAEALRTPPTLWWLSAEWPPLGRPAERHYARATDALAAHNLALASRPQPAPVQALARGRLDPASQQALAALLEAVEAQAGQGNRVLRGTDAGSHAVELASARGTAFAAAMLMRGLRDDNSAAIRTSGRAARWGEALDALDAAARIDPVFTRSDDLVKVGYSLLLAGNAMRAILEGQG